MYTLCRCASPWPTACAQSTLKALQDQVALYAACFLQLCMMARASTVGGNAVFNEDASGIHADLQVDDVGLTYVIRFLVVAVSGLRPPRRLNSLKPNSCETRCLSHLPYLT
jgi:hypothetical protein